MIISILSITKQYIQTNNYYNELHNIICKIYHKDENPNDHYDDGFCLADQYAQDNIRKPDINYWFNPRVLNFYHTINLDNINLTHQEYMVVNAKNENYEYFGFTEDYIAYYIGDGSYLEHLNFYDYDKDPLIVKWLILQYDTDKTKEALKKYIKDNPRVLDYFIFGEYPSGAVVIYRRFSWLRDITDEKEKKDFEYFIKFIDAIRNTKKFKEKFKKGKKKINEDIKRFNK